MISFPFGNLNGTSLPPYKISWRISSTLCWSLHLKNARIALTVSFTFRDLPLRNLISRRSPMTEPEARGNYEVRQKECNCTECLFFLFTFWELRPWRQLILQDRLQLLQSSLFLFSPPSSHPMQHNGSLLRVEFDTLMGFWWKATSATYRMYTVGAYVLHFD